MFAKSIPLSHWFRAYKANIMSVNQNNTVWIRCYDCNFDLFLHAVILFPNSHPYITHFHMEGLYWPQTLSWAKTNHFRGLGCLRLAHTVLGLLLIFQQCGALEREFARYWKNVCRNTICIRCCRAFALRFRYTAQGMEYHCYCQLLDSSFRLRSFITCLLHSGTATFHVH